MQMIEAGDQAALENLRKRNIDFDAVVDEVRPIVQAVKAEGDAAVARFVQQFDKKEWRQAAVSADQIIVSQDIKEALADAKQNIWKFHAEQKPKEWQVEILPGIKAGQLVRPLARVGCYVPGGKFPLLSSVLMTVLPAKVAGVDEVIVCTPRACPEILYACALCGVDEIYEVGGPMAIAAMAYGTETIRKVDKIVGPGNLYVSAAKKIVYGDVGIDFIAGPSEVVIIAEEGANPEFIAADLLAQAEHGGDSMALCLTTSRRLGEEIVKAVERRLADLPTKETARISTETRGAVVLVQTLEEAFDISNVLAPEHLEIYSEDWNLLKLVQNAGSVFLGPYSPEAAGDYASGPNHVLPTGGMAAALSGLSVKDFVKTPTFQCLTQEGLRRIAPTIIALAEAEGLAGHAESVKVRLPC